MKDGCSLGTLAWGTFWENYSAPPRVASEKRAHQTQVLVVWNFTGPGEGALLTFFPAALLRGGLAVCGAALPCEAFQVNHRLGVQVIQAGATWLGRGTDNRRCWAAQGRGQVDRPAVLVLGRGRMRRR